MGANLTQCPDCGQQVSKNAEACPHCGKELKGRENFTMGMAMGCLIVIIIGLLIVAILIWLPCFVRDNESAFAASARKTYYAYFRRRTSRELPAKYTPSERHAIDAILSGEHIGFRFLDAK
jgi:hypothetical protein